MDPMSLLLRWAHIVGAVLAIGGLAFARFGLLPALADFDEETRARIHESIRRRWLPLVILSITLLLVSGLANFLLFNRLVKEQGWAGGTWMQQTSYHALFGVKFLLAMGVFYFSSGLMGRSRGTQWIRDNRSTWLTITLGMAIGIVGDAGVRANGQQPRLFVGMILILIFAEALGLYGLIVAIVLSQVS